MPWSNEGVGSPGMKMIEVQAIGLNLGRPPGTSFTWTRLVASREAMAAG